MLEIMQEKKIEKEQIKGSGQPSKKNETTEDLNVDKQPKSVKRKLETEKAKMDVDKKGKGIYFIILLYYIELLIEKKRFGPKLVCEKYQRGKNSH